VREWWTGDSYRYFFLYRYFKCSKIMFLALFQVLPHWNLQSDRSQNRLSGQHPELVSPSWHVHADRDLRARHPPACRSSAHLLYCGACKSFQVHGAHERSHCHYDWYSIKVLSQVSVFFVCMGYRLSVRTRWLDIGQVLFLWVYGPRRSRGP